MHAALAIQYVAVALIVLASAWMVMKRQCPGLARRLRIALALRLLRTGRPAWLQGLGKRIAPAAQAGDDGCGACNGCDPGARKR